MFTYKVTFTQGGFYDDVPVMKGFQAIESFDKEMTDKDLQHYYENAHVTGKFIPKSDWEDLFQ